jgi:nicotinamide-nucleotide amidase
MEATSETIHQCLGLLVFGYEDSELQNTLVRMLEATGKTLATCELGSAGVIAQWLGEACRGTSVFKGGVTLGSASSATALDVAPELATHSGGNQESLVKSLAEAVRKRFNADYGLAVGDLPNAGDIPATAEIYFALASDAGTTSKSNPAAAHSAIVKPLAAKAALNFVRLSLVRHIG